MRLFTTTHKFNYSWQQVSAANWRKYPNEDCPHVVSVDVLDRRVDPETGIMVTERLLTIEQNAPAFIRRILGQDVTVQYCHEISILDPRNKTLSMKSRNLSWQNVMTVEERITYKGEGDQTVFTQEAEINASNAFSRVKEYIEDFCVKRFSDNAAKGRDAFERVLVSLTGERQGLAV
ncbi:uncharacterized protein VTP21DRAFT_6789 [Calcarisporiella thermophila]|uniref:uncharacterized protein n=1 Tax=Calcarisporiella thermophila TaxID=911321 RepID=UPI0037422308